MEEEEANRCGRGLWEGNDVNRITAHFIISMKLL